MTNHRLFVVEKDWKQELVIKDTVSHYVRIAAVLLCSYYIQTVVLILRHNMLLLVKPALVFDLLSAMHLLFQYFALLVSEFF